VKERLPQTSRFDQSVQWFIERAGTRAVEWALVLATAWILAIAVPLTNSLQFLVFGASPEQFLRSVAIMGAGSALVMVFLGAKFMADAKPLRAWFAGSHDEKSAVAAHEWIIAGLPRVIFVGAVVFAVMVVPAAAIVGRTYGLGPIGVLAFVAASLVMVAGTAIFAFLVLEQALRTVLREINLLADTSAVVARGVSLRAKVMWFVPISVLFATTSISPIRTGRFSQDVELAIMMTAAFGATITFGWVMATLLRRSVLERAELLGRALGRVGVGDFSLRLVASHGDELDEIVHDFNEMTERLAVHDADLRESRARIVTASDESRRRVERDLHDGAQQYLVLMELKLGLLARKFADDPETSAMTAELRTDLSHALAELRDLAHGLYPAVLETDGLAAALQAAGERSPLPVSVEADGVGRVAPEVEAAVYFCCLEAMQNAAKHAGDGASITVTLGASAGQLRFAVADNGRGYDTDALGTSHGLQNMVDRIGALGGELSIKSSLGKGTVVSGSTPVDTR
jgi:signal transduction histidine kinase